MQVATLGLGRDGSTKLHNISRAAIHLIIYFNKIASHLHEKYIYPMKYHTNEIMNLKDLQEDAILFLTYRSISGQICSRIRINSCQVSRNEIIKPLNVIFKERETELLNLDNIIKHYLNMKKKCTFRITSYNYLCDMSDHYLLLECCILILKLSKMENSNILKFISLFTSEDVESMDKKYKFSYKAAIKEQSKLDNFEHFDTLSLIHGNHISSNNDNILYNTILEEIKDLNLENTLEEEDKKHQSKIKKIIHNRLI